MSKINSYISLDPTKTYGIPIANGVLKIDVSQDPMYPGIDIEFDTESDNIITRPRVLIEAPIDAETKVQNNLRAVIWADENSEDYSDCINFTDNQMK